MSPVKNTAGLKAAAPFADAVYFGISEFNLRANSNGITLDSLDCFMNYCHEEGVLGYMTVNSVLYNNEIKRVEKVLKRAKEAGVDAVIVWDPAAIDAAKRVGIDFFISTQANVSNWKTAQFYKDLGAKRVILSREMSLSQVEETKKRVDVEIETFIHGAMCIAISGRCLLSGYYEDSSANRGACNQLCRRNFKLIDDQENKLETDGKSFLSSKDLCMIEHIPELIEAGVDSFKIEGRQRSSKYVRETAKYYRKAIDLYFEGAFSIEKAKEWKRQLGKVYNRGFTTGFYFGNPGPKGISFESGSVATRKRIQAGSVKHFYGNSGVAVIELKHRGVQVGEDLIIEGETTYLEQSVKSLEIDGDKKDSVCKGEEVGLKTKGKVRKNDKVYVLVD